MTVDHLVIGAGASGMSVVDELVAGSDHEVLLVDRRHEPGGHWVDAYPFLRLHQPSAYYGVNSIPLGRDRIDTHGPNAGMYERASAAEVCDHYRRALDEVHLASGRVRFLGGHSYLGPDGDDHVLRSELTGALARARVRRRVVDATYVASEVPARRPPPFAVGDGARVVTPDRLVALDEPAAGFVVVGAGKTAMDVCGWLLDQGVAPDLVTWVRPADGWLLDRAFAQPLELVASMARYQAALVAAAVEATSGLDLALRLEAAGVFHRLTDGDTPVFRGATVSRIELDQLRTIERVVAGRRVRGVARDRMQMVDGTWVATAPGVVYVDCTAQGLSTAPRRPIWDGDHLTVQITTMGVAPWSAAIIGKVETLDVDDDERNRLCPVVGRTGLIDDHLGFLHRGFEAESVRRASPELAGWSAGARLNAGRAIADRADDPEVVAALTSMLTDVDAAMANLATRAG